MAPQEHIPLAANILGTIGTVCWCVQLVPQVWYNWRQKKTDGLPALMVMLWSVCGVPFGVYAVVQNFTIAIQVQPQMFILLTLVCWAQILYYNSGWTAWKATAAATVVGILFGAAEALLILTLRGPYAAGVSWPITLIGIIAAILLAAGLIPPYFELAKRGGRVVGINFVFLTVDWSGAFFSMLALIAQQSFDVLGGIMYIVCMLLEFGIFLSHWIWLYRTRRIRKEAKDAKMTYDEYVAQQDFAMPVNASKETLGAPCTAATDLEKGTQTGESELPQTTEAAKITETVETTEAMEATQMTEMTETIATLPPATGGLLESPISRPENCKINN